MGLENLFNLFKSKEDEPLLAVDIGSSSIKMLAFKMQAGKPRLIACAITQTPAGALQNNAVVQPEKVGEAIRSALNASEIRIKRAVFSIPGPAAFTKKITIGSSTLKELSENIGFEAMNYIPHAVESVHLDFQILRELSKSSIEVLLVAVKNEIVQSYLRAIESAGLEPVIADIDYFALENIFQLSHPEEKSSTVALVNIGARFSSVSILSEGESLIVGDVAVGSRLYTEALSEALGITQEQAEEVKSGVTLDGVDAALIREVMDRTTEQVTGELQRQISFLWSAALTERPVISIYLSGAGAQLSGIASELSAKTGTKCQLLKPMRGVELEENFDPDYINEVALSLGVCCGLALRRPGDKVHARMTN